MTDSKYRKCSYSMGIIQNAWFDTVVTVCLKNIVLIPFVNQL